MINYILLAIFVALQFGDAWTTINVIKENKGHEGNAVMAWIFEKIGVLQGFLVMKVITVIAVYFIVPAWPALLVLNLVYGYVVYQNYRILKA